MQVHDYIRVLRRNWIPLIASVALGMATAVALFLLLPKSYVSETKLFVSMQSGDSVVELQQGSTFAQSRITSYVDAATTASVLQPVVDDLDLSVSVEELASQVSATALTDSVIININASGSTPAVAAAIANAVAESLIDTVQEVESPQDPAESPVQVSVLQPAQEPADPASPNLLLNLFVGMIAGILVGLGWAALRELLDTRIRGEHDIAKHTSAPLLGSIAFDGDAVKHPLVTQIPAQSPRSEAFRRVRTNLQFVRVGNANSAILVTSSVPGEGKTSTSANLALTIADSGQRVALIEGDLRRPRLSRYFGMDNSVGLTTVLLGQVELCDALQPWGDGELYVLASGQLPPNPAELLGSDRMRDLLGYLNSSFDVVIIDGPPLLPVTDSAVMSQIVGGVVMVVSVKDAKGPELSKSLSSLGLVDADVLGVVLNKAPAKGPDAYSYSYEYSDQPSGIYTGTSAEHEPASTTAGIRDHASRSIQQPSLPVSDEFKTSGVRSDRTYGSQETATTEMQEDAARTRMEEPQFFRASRHVNVSGDGLVYDASPQRAPSHDLTYTEPAVAASRTPPATGIPNYSRELEDASDEFARIIFSADDSDSQSTIWRGRHSR